MICNLCPRNCSALRTEKEGKGVCKMPSLPVVARAGLHFWEEPVISGTKGSGTVFFSGCSLGCVFCQNEEISHKRFGKAITPEHLANIFKNLEEQGAHNINLVNPTHYLDAIEKAVSYYKPEIPFVYNSSGYETIESIERAAKFCDIFLIDLKYMSSEKAGKYSSARDYPEVAKKAILKCQELIGDNVYDKDGIMQRGLIVRHLILPLCTNDAIKVIDFAKNNLKGAALSLMSQYTPFGNLENYKELQRKITKREYNKVLDYAITSGIENIFTQDLSSSNEDYIPSFDLSGI